MTRRVWKTEDGWDIACGWDRMLQHFFLDIGRDCGGCDGEGIITDGFGGTEDDPRDCTTCDGRGTEYLFNNLDAPDRPEAKNLADEMGGMTLEQINTAMDKYLTQWPLQVLPTLAMDKLNDVGNNVRDFGTIGKVRVA